MSRAPIAIEYRLTSPGPATPVAIGLGLLAVVLGAGAMVISSPPHVELIWLIVWALCFWAAITALHSARKNPALGNRIGAGVAVLLALLGAWIPIDAYLGNFGDYPWLVVLPLAFLGTVGAHRSGLLPVAFATTAILSRWFYPAFLPPTTHLPATQRANGLECTLLPRDPENPQLLKFEVRYPANASTIPIQEPRRVRMVGYVGPFIELHRSRASIPGLTLRDSASSSAITFASVFPVPWWTRSFDLDITVPPFQTRRTGQGWDIPVVSHTVFHFDRVPAR